MPPSTQSNINVIDTGTLQDSAGNYFDYEVRHGWDIRASFQCDSEWSRWSAKLFDYIDKQNYDVGKLTEVLSSIQTEDLHWDWSAKSVHTKSDSGYEWFYLYADNQPQGACLISQPKDSALENSKIFYVKFIAVAPWNRNCCIQDRLFKGVGSILLLSAQKLAVDKLGLTPGFSLHSLPQAIGYYEKLDMIRVTTEDEGTLAYLELPLAKANQMKGGL